MTSTNTLLKESEEFIIDYFAEHLSANYVFHDPEHTAQTVAAAKTIGEGFHLNDKEMQILLLATWFHDTGYAHGPVDHEDRSCQIASEFLKDKISDEDLEEVKACIQATKVPQMPQNLLQQIICDADLSHLGMKTYWERNSKLRQEFTLTRNSIMNDNEWVEFELEFMVNHEYHTEVARALLNKRKAKNIQKLLKQKKRLNPKMALTVDELNLLDGKKKKDRHSLEKVLLESEAEIKLSRFGRGVETMYRTTYRTHTNLSSMADSKANLMLSVNAIVISILVSNLLPKLIDEFTVTLFVPFILLTITCLGSMVYATLSTRPKITEGKITRDDIKQR